jgi:hypothetical protein
LSTCHLAFGLRLRSNIPLPEVPLADPLHPGCDAELHLGMAPAAELVSSQGSLFYTSSFTDSTGEPALRIWSLAEGTWFRLCYSDGHRFWLDRNGTEVWAVWPAWSSIEEVSSYLLGPVLGILLRYRGVISLHASSVAVDGRAVAFVGPPGAGKSTAAATIGRLGCPIVADDITALEERNGQFFVNPAYPGVSLWPDSVESLYGANASAGSRDAAWEKRRIASREGLQFQGRPLPLKKIFILGDNDNEGFMSPVGTLAQKRLLSLISNTYATNILDSRMRAEELIVLGRLASNIDIAYLEAHPSVSQLKGCCVSA